VSARWLAAVNADKRLEGLPTPRPFLRVIDGRAPAELAFTPAAELIAQVQAEGLPRFFARGGVTGTTLRNIGRSMPDPRPWFGLAREVAAERRAIMPRHLTVAREGTP
jgi:hypothetical protein